MLINSLRLAGLIFAFVFAATACATLASATPMADATCVDDSREAFKRAVHGHLKAYEALTRQRGVRLEPADLPEPRALDADALQKFVSADLTYLEGKSSGQPVIVFYAQDADYLCGFMLSSRLPLLYHRAALGPSAVADLQDAWRGALAIERLVASRAPRKRAAESGFADPPSSGRSEPEARAALSSALIPREFGRAIPANAEIIVVPTNEIGTVPFALLDLPTGERLIERTAVTIAANLWEALLVERDDLLNVATGASEGPFPGGAHERQIGMAPGWSKAILIGDPDATADPDWYFPPLPAARREVEEIGELLAGDRLSGPAERILVGAGATRSAVLEAMSGAPSLIYFAAHGVADFEEPLDGFIALADGRLTAREVQSTLTGASLVVLSACQTGLGRSHPGGVIGLARGFQLGGAVAVVMSLWSVDDEATRLLMTHFMRRVGHVSPSQALREAMLGLRETHTDPVLWGGFQVFGSLLPLAR